MTLRDTADQIIRASLRAVQPDAAVQRALQEFSCAGRVVLIAIGKAAWAMANAAWDTLSTRITSGAVITKYGHSRGPIGPLQIFEAGHPVPDEAGLRAAQAALELTRGLREEDCVLFLISGGGSALFESPLVPLAELEDITGQLLSCGADIVEINTIRKRLSAVKGGRFALHCRPAPVFSVVLSDILGDPLDMIASGPAVPDTSTCGQAIAIAEKYHLRLSTTAQELLRQETLVDDGAHTLAVVNNTDVVHDLGNADDVVHVQQLADFPGEELRAGVFHAGQGRDTRRSEHVLAELGLFRILKHEAHAVETHDVADLVRVGADGRRAPRQNGAGEIFGDHHRALDVHMCVDVAGNQVAALTVVVRFGRQDCLLSFLTHQNNKSVQYVDTGRIDFSRNDIEKLYVADRQIARDLTHCRLNEARAILCLACTHQNPSLKS